MKKQYNAKVLIAFILLNVSLLFMTISSLQNYYLLHIAFSLSFATALLIAWKTISSSRCQMDWKEYCIIAISIIIVMSPMFLNGFLYGDDLWAFGNTATPNEKNISGSIGMRRPLNGIISSTFNSLTFDTSWKYRVVTTVALVLLTCIIYAYIKKTRKSKTVAFTVTILFGCSTVLIDCIAYAAVSSIIYAMFLATVGYILFDKAYVTKNIVKYIISALLLLMAFEIYQIVTPIVFVLFMITIFHNGRKDTCYFKKAFVLLLEYALVAIAYFLLTDLIMSLYGVSEGQVARSKFISSWPQVIEKISWFINKVIPQTCYKLTGIIFGKGTFTTNNLFYEVEYNNPRFGNLVLIIILGAIAIYFVRFVVQKRLISLFISLCAIILSFYPFLILPESYTLSYYMIPLFFLTIYYSIEGFYIGLKWIVDKMSQRIKTTVKGILLFAMYFSSCILICHGIVYSNNWVTYCRDSHVFIRQSLSANLTDNTEKVCVVGRISPYVGGNPYVIYSTKMALKELGYEPKDYEVIQIDNPYYITEMTYKDMNTLKECLTSEEFEKLNSYYLYDEMYNRYLYNYSADAKGKEFIQKCLIAGDLIIFENDERNILIPLSGFTKTHAF